jgi:bacillithiol biosynthesis cysteine-adding enzyme BshC
MMKRIPVQHTKLVPEIVIDYLEQHPELRHFYSQPNQIENYAAIKQQRQQFSSKQRENLHAHLLQQYKNADIDLTVSTNHMVLENLNLLLNKQCFTVCTGHQLVLFGGPLFTTYKILTTIQLARELSQLNTEEPVVPVFWLATEDHDFEEIQSAYIAGKNLTLDLPHQAEPVGEMVLQGIEKLIDELASSLPSNTMANTFVKQVKAAYQNGFTLAKSSIRFYHELFADFGLVILDANAKCLKETVISVIKNDVLNQSNYIAQKASDSILGKHYHLQINARPINFFYLNQDGERFLIQATKNKQFILSSKADLYGEKEIIELIENFPERFSPNVNLRPLYQEMILPNLAYIGGPSEIAYWLQLKSIFDLNQVQFPILVLRHMQAFVDANLASALEKLKLKAVHLLLTESELEQVFYAQSELPGIEKQIAGIEQNWQEIYEANLKINDEMAKNILQAKLIDRKDLKSIQKQYIIQRKNKLAVQFKKVVKYRSQLYPEGKFQERIDQLISFESVKMKPLLSEILNELDPFNSSFLFFDL